VRSGRPAQGLGMIDDAIEIAGSERTVLPELYLLKGDLLLVDESGSAAESWFQLGLDMAEVLIKMSQLRASVRRRLWRDQDTARGEPTASGALMRLRGRHCDLVEARDVLDSG
jgi:hypothetical protein